MITIRRRTAAAVLATACLGTAIAVAPANAATADAFTRLTSASGRVSTLAVQDDTHNTVAVISSEAFGTAGRLEIIAPSGALVSSEPLPGASVTTSVMDSADASQVWFVADDGLYLRTPTGTTKVAVPTAPDGATTVSAVHDLPGGDALIAVGTTVYRGHGGAWVSLGDTFAGTTPQGPQGIRWLDEYQGTVIAGVGTHYGAGYQAYRYDGRAWTAGATYGINYGPMSVDVIPSWVPMSATRLDGFGSTMPRGGTAVGWHVSLFENHDIALPEPIARAVRGTNGSAVLVNPTSVLRLGADDTLTRLPGSIPGISVSDMQMAASEDGSYIVVSPGTAPNDLYVMTDGTTPTSTPTTPAPHPTTTHAPKPSKPTKPCKPTKPAHPVKQPKPTKPSKPTKPAHPAKPSKPAHPGKSS